MGIWHHPFSKQDIFLRACALFPRIILARSRLISICIPDECCVCVCVGRRQRDTSYALITLLPLKTNSPTPSQRPNESVSTAAVRRRCVSNDATSHPAAARTWRECWHSHIQGKKDLVPVPPPSPTWEYPAFYELCTMCISHRHGVKWVIKRVGDWRIWGKKCGENMIC